MNDKNNLICTFLKKHVIGKSLKTDEAVSVQNKLININHSFQ